jgi:Ser/Thr protein kinase RdoA (MazF antagonist)
MSEDGTLHQHREDEPQPLQQVARDLLGDVDPGSISTIRPDLAVALSSSGRIVVKRWPPATTRSRARFVHAVVEHLATTATEVVVAPYQAIAEDEDQSLVEVARRLYDVRSWIEGRTWAPSPRITSENGATFHTLSLHGIDAITTLAEAIGRIHEASTSMPVHPNRREASVKRFSTASAEIFNQQRQKLRRIAPNHPHIQHWLRASESMLPAAQQTLQEIDFLRSEPSVVCHLDLWPGHILSTRSPSGAPTIGMIDFELAAITSPLLDLAQVASRFRGWTAESADAILSGYSSSTSLTPAARRSFPAITVLTLIVDTGHYLERAWLSDLPPETPEASAIRKVCAQSVASLEALQSTIVRESRRPGAGRTWQRRGPASSKKAPGASSRVKRDQQPT